MDLIKISQLDQQSEIVNNDFFPLVDSGSLTTVKATFGTLATWAEGYATASFTVNANFSDYALTASYAPSCSLALTTSYLLYQGFSNGTVSYALYAEKAETASYVDTTADIVGFATYAKSASWVSSSVSASYVSAFNVDGTVVSASYALTASYAITASYILSGSYAESASNSGTSSHVSFAESAAGVVSLNAYGPFVADPDSISTVAWGQYDETKRSVAFILEEQADVVVKCSVNYNTSVVPGTLEYHYFGAKLIAEGLPDPLIGLIPNPNSVLIPTTNADLDMVKMVSIRDITGNGYVEGTVEFEFRINTLNVGQYRVYIIPLKTIRHIGPIEYAVSASNAQIADYTLFLSDVLVQGVIMKIPKFSNSVQVIVYSQKSVLQGLYPTPEIPTPITTWKFWEINYQVTNVTLVNGQFEYVYNYQSSLGNGEANWIGPLGSIGQVIKVKTCLPTDHVLTSVVTGPMGTIISGPTVTTIPCNQNGEGNDRYERCGGWYIYARQLHQFYCP